MCIRDRTKGTQASRFGQEGSRAQSRCPDLRHDGGLQAKDDGRSRNLSLIHIYEQYIESAAEHLYDPAKMGDVSKLEHQYDCQIHSADDAVKYANLALNIVDDPFTKVMSASEVQVLKEHEAGEIFAIGIVAFNHGPAAAYRPMRAPLFVEEVYPGSPAAKAGIKSGDKICLLYTSWLGSWRAIIFPFLISTSTKYTRLLPARCFALSKHGKAQNIAKRASISISLWAVSSAPA